MILSYTFSVSSVFVFGLLFIKVYEYTHRKKIFISRFLSRFDPKMERYIERVFSHYEMFRAKTLSLVKEEAPHQIRYFFILLKKTAKERYATLVLNVRGNRKLREDLNVSPFLRDISKHKEEHGGGRIDDTMVE